MHFTLHMTSRCNLRCDYCYVNHGGEMTFETARAAVDLASADGAKTAGFVFFGGEPLLKRDLIFDTVAYAREKEKTGITRFSFKITTNGLLLDDSFLDFAKRESFFIALSVDGTQEAHDMHRVMAPDGGKLRRGSYAQVSEAAKRLLRVFPQSPGMMTVRPDTLHLMADGVKSLFDLGFVYAVSSLDYSADWKDEHLPVLQEQYQRIAELYAEKTRRGDKFYYAPFESKISSHINSREYCTQRCELGLRQVSVGPDGTIFPCVQFVGDETYKLGDVFNGIDENLRKGMYSRNEKRNDCGDCVLKKRCNCHCACMNRQATGSIDKVSPMLCAHERTVIPIADKVAGELYEENPHYLDRHYKDFVHWFH